MFDLSKYKDAIACITPSGDHLSYGELQGLSDKIIKNLKTRKLVFSLCSNSIRSVAGHVSFVNNHNATLLLD
jgi:hypothetical protein